jgi:thiamine kinase-like enzyme
MQNWTNIETSLAPPAGQRVPANADQLTAEWLTACLRHAGVLAAPARVAALHSERIGQGRGFAGRIARVSLHYDPDGAGPRTLIAKFASDHAGTRQLLATFNGYAREVRFYRELAPRVGAGVPRCYFAHYDRAGAEFLLLLEDMASAGTADMESGLSLEQAEAVLDRLAHMHASFWRRIDELDWLQITPELIDAMRERFLAALPRFIERFGAQYPRTARVARQMAVVLGDDAMMATVRRPPLTLTHNDVHVNNLLLPAEGGDRFALIDWQSVSLSRHGMNDVARVLAVCITAELRRSHGGALLRHYRARLRAHGVQGYSRLVFEHRLRQETAGMVIVGVMAFDSLDFAGEQGERTAAIMGERIEGALADARVMLLLSLFTPWLRLKRGLRRLLAALPWPGHGR